MIFISTIILLLIGSASSQEFERAGIILNYKDRYLLVQNKFSFRWSFTKGHVEPFDVNLLETAQREVKEESGYLETIHYTIDDTEPRMYGKSTYWTGTVINADPPKLKEDEHLGFGWFTKEEMRKLKTTSDISEWL